MGEQITNSLGNISTPFEYGGGHIQPSKAADPGLIYDANYTDYVIFICSSSGISIDPSYECPVVVPSPSQLNYPSSLTISGLSSSSSSSTTATVTRTVTNVGADNSTYSLKIENPPGFSVQISPNTLFFDRIGETQSFTITVEANSNSTNDFSFGWFAWSDGIHAVRSPIVLSY